MSTPTTTETSFDILRRIAITGNYVTPDDVSRLVKDHPKKQVMIITGCGRFTTTMDCCKHYTEIISASTDYVRSVCLPTNLTAPKPITRKTPKSRNWPYSPTELTPQYP